MTPLTRAKVLQLTLKRVRGVGVFDTWPWQSNLLCCSCNPASFRARTYSLKVLVSIFTGFVWTRLIALEPTITMHDLYKAYAEWYVTRGDGSKYPWCVYEGPPTNVSQTHSTQRNELISRGKLSTQNSSSSNVLSIQNKKIRRSPPSNCWGDLMRIRIFGWKGSLSTTKILEWRNVVVLQLYFCSDVKELNLFGLCCLRHLELIGLENLVMLTFSNGILEARLWYKRIEGQTCHFIYVISCCYLECSSLTSLPKELRTLKSLIKDLETKFGIWNFWRPLNCTSLETFPEGMENLTSLGLCGYERFIRLPDMVAKGGRVTGARVTRTIHEPKRRGDLGHVGIPMEMIRWGPCH